LGYKLPSTGRGAAKFLYANLYHPWAYLLLGKNTLDL